MIFAGLAGAFPTHALIGEESASASPTGKVGALTDGYTWVVDPIEFVGGVAAWRCGGSAAAALTCATVHGFFSFFLSFFSSFVFVFCS